MVDAAHHAVAPAEARHIRVLRIIPTIDPEVGGPSNSAVNAAIAEARSGAQTTFAFTGDARSAQTTAAACERLVAAGVKPMMFPRVRAGGAASGLWGISVQLSGWVARHAREFDVIHVHYVWTLSTLVGVIAGSLTGRPVLLTAHESLTSYDIDTASGSALKRRAKLALRRILMRRVTTVICASDLERRDSLLPGEHGLVIAHPVAAQPRDRPVPEPTGPFTVGYLGRLHPKKNVDLVLRGFAKLDDEDARLVIAGDGPPAHRRALQALADELGITPRVDWLGHVGPLGRERFLARSHVVAMPSAYECFGMAAAEALSAGVPVISSPTTGVASIIRDLRAGVVLPETSAAAVGDALARVRADPSQRLAMRDAAIHAVRSRLSFAAYGELVLAAYVDAGARSA